jgi:hypothetical protein
VILWLIFIFGVIGALSLWDHLSGRSKKECPYCHKQLDKGKKNTSSNALTQYHKNNEFNKWVDYNNNPIFNKSEWSYLYQIPELNQAYTMYRRIYRMYLNDWEQILDGYPKSSREYQLGKSFDKQVADLYQDVRKVVRNDSIRKAIESVSRQGEGAKDLYKDAVLMVIDKLNKASEETSALRSKANEKIDAIKDAEVKDLVAQWQQSRTTSRTESPDTTPADTTTEDQELVDLSDAFDAMVQEDEQLKKKLGSKSTIDEDLWDTENQSDQQASF